MTLDLFDFLIQVPVVTEEEIADKRFWSRPPTSSEINKAVADFRSERSIRVKSLQEYRWVVGKDNLLRLILLKGINANDRPFVIVLSTVYTYPL